MVEGLEQNALSTSSTITSQCKPIADWTGPFDNKIMKGDFLKEWYNRGMTNTELSEVFQTADVDKNGILAKDEWEAFRKIFVEDFDRWDVDRDCSLTSAETVGMVNSSYFGTMSTATTVKGTFEGFGSNESEDYKEQDEDVNVQRISSDLIIAVDRDLDGKMNFAEYMLVRKGSVAWKECAQGGMNRSALKCALNLTIKDRAM